MTDLLSDVDTPSDAELISRVRGGDVTAYGDLFSRHQAAAHRLARQLVRGPDSDDLVSEAFAKVLAVLQGGGGPDVAFRAYLLTAVRRLHVDRVRAGQRLHTTDDLTPFDPGVPFQDTAVAGFENGAAAKAFASLPERWQLVLWHLEVEGQKPADIAPLLGMSANSVSALAYRAREGLRQAFLTMHISDLTETDCRWVNEHLGAFIRSGLSKRDSGKVQQHLDGCRRCTAMYLELTEVNSNLAGIIGPLLLGAAATGYLASSGAGAAGLLGLLSRAKDLVLANTGAATAAAGVAVGVTAAAAVAAVVIAAGSPSPDKVVADPSRGTVTTAPASPGTTPGGQASDHASPSASADPTTLPTTLPTAVAPSATVSALPVLPTDTATVAPTDLPSDLPTDLAPSDTAAPAAPPDRFIGDPVVDPAGFVTVETRNLRADDVVDISLGSDETTLSDPATDPTCRVVTGRHAVCTPGAVDLQGGGQAVPTVAIGDYTIRLALDFPGYMLADDVSVRVSVDGQSGASSAVRSFRPGRAASYDFAALRVTGPASHTVTGDVDHYRFGTTASLPPRVTGLRYELTGPGRFRPADAEGCTVSEDRTVLRCPDVRRGDAVVLPVDAEGLAGAVGTGVAVSSLDDVVDTTPDDRTDTLTLRPGTTLALAPGDLGALHATGRDYPVTLHLSGVRAGLPAVTYALGDGTTVTGSSTPGCTPTDRGELTCAAPVPADVTFTVRSATPARPTPLTVAVAPGGDFEELGGDSTATGSLVAAHDFSMGALTQVGHTVTGDTDHYTLRSQVAAVPAAVDRLTFRLTGAGSFAAGQDARCAVVDARTVSCGDLAGGRPVDFAVDADGTTRPDVTIALSVPAGYDDTDPGNESGSIANLTPGVDLSLTPLRPDNASPANDDDQHLVSTTLGGVRRGLPQVTYTLTGAATFVGADVAGCTPSGTTLTCTGPADGPVTFTVRATDTRAATDIGIAVAAPAPYDELARGDNADAVTLAPRPTYDFALSPLQETGHSVSGGTDAYTLRSTVSALPAGLGEVAFTVTGGTFAAGQDAGCTRTGTTTVSCGDLTSARAIDFRVESTSTAAHDVTVALQVPRRYDDPDTSDDSRTARVVPGVDLATSAPTPADPAPQADRTTYQVSTAMSGVRPGLGPVRYSVTGAALTDVSGTGCSLSGSTVTCTAPADGRVVTFTLRPTNPRAATPVTVELAPSAPFVELAPADNSVVATLAPDVVLGAVTQTADSAQYASVRVAVSGVPPGVSTVRLRVSGSAAGLEAGKTHFTQGASGADGEGNVDCFTSDASGNAATNGLYATCTGVGTATAGRFYVDTRLAHQHGTDSAVDVTVVPVGVDEGTHGANNSGAFTVR